MTEAALLRRFVEDLTPFGVLIEAAEHLFSDLRARHREPHRRYHGLDHLTALSDLLDRYAPEISPGAPARLAVWWHDAVYDPRARDNEETSADLCRLHLREAGAPASVIEQTAGLILRTCNHWDGPSMGAGDAFLDADIAILGAPTDAYERYAAAVREEYAWVSDDAFQAGRRAFLAAALERPRLFRTVGFETAFAGPARANMQRELDRLAEGPA